MKQKLYYLGLLCAILVFAGTFFKINHWPGANIMIAAGLLTLSLVFIPVALINLYRADGEKNNRLLFIVTGITCLVVFIAMLFKLLHWPFAGILLTIALPLPYILFLPVFLFVTSKNPAFSIHNTVFVLILLVTQSVVSVLLALTVTREVTTDTLNMSANFNRVEVVLDKTGIQGSGSTVTAQIDEVLSLLKEFQEIYYSEEGITREEFLKDPPVIIDGKKEGITSSEDTEKRKEVIPAQLKKSIIELLNAVKLNPEGRQVEGLLQVLFGMKSPEDDEFQWIDWLSGTKAQPQVHIVLDGLETNLKLIRFSLSD
jgi:hypothetical protein